MSHGARADLLAGELAQVVAQAIKLIPREFAARCGVSKPLIDRYHPEIAKAINAHAWKHCPERMRGPRPSEGAPAAARRKATAERTRREHEALAKEVPALRAEVAESRRAAVELRRTAEVLRDGIATRERLIEVLLLRAAGADPSACRDVERVLREVRTVERRDPPGA